MSDERSREIGEPTLPMPLPEQLDPNADPKSVMVTCKHCGTRVTEDEAILDLCEECWEDADRD